MASIQNSERLILGGGVIGLSCAYYLLEIIFRKNGQGLAQ